MQMVALNFQTNDTGLQLNTARFMTNGNCGFVVKPDVLRIDHGFDPFDTSDSDNTIRQQLSIQVRLARLCSRCIHTVMDTLWSYIDSGVQVLSAQHLMQGKASVFVEVEILALPHEMRKFRTRTVTGNGLDLYWSSEEESFTCKVDANSREQAAP